jgi:sodium-dependent dicarboxylate transporter 2/3/5
MGVTAGLSMWVSNTATAVMMLPIAIGVIQLADIDSEDAGEGARFSLCLLLGIAYAASIGGVGTLVGTPPNLFLASYVHSELGVEISFAGWLSIGLPIVVCFLPVAWLLLTRWLFPLGSLRIEHGREHFDEALRELGAIKRGEWATLVVFLVTAVAWILRPVLTRLSFGDHRPLAGLSDPGIAISAALVLFVIPVRVRDRVFVMDWSTAAGLPWGLLVLFGGGLSLAAAIRANGVGEFLGHSAAGLAGMPPLFVMLALVTLMIFLTEITSNTATAATLIPIVAGLAPGLGVDALLLVVPVAIAASCAFMLPVATPPNAVVFGSGKVGVAQMSRAGFWLNLIGIGLITGLCYALVLPVLGRAAS